MADQTEKPKLGTRPPLGLKRTVETGKVKQSFSHGRSNTVVVEVKKRRILGRPGDLERMEGGGEEERPRLGQEARQREDRTKIAQSEDERRRAEENRKAEEQSVEEARPGAEEEVSRAAEAPTEPEVVAPQIEEE